MLGQMATMTRPLSSRMARQLERIHLFHTFGRYDVLLAGYLKALAQIVEHVKNFVVVRKLLDGPVRNTMRIPAMKLSQSAVP